MGGSLGLWLCAWVQVPLPWLGTCLCVLRVPGVPWENK